MSIKHSFVSGVTDGADPTQVQPSNWNAPHVTDTPSGITVSSVGVLLGRDDGSGHITIEGLNGSALQYLRKRGNTLVEGFEFTNPNFVSSASLNFSGVNPGINLTAGITNTVVLPFGLLGVAGTNTEHEIRITDTIGISETVLITGGTATSGVAGTLTFVPANNHTAGNYTLQSATAGISEAKWIISADGGIILLPAGVLNIYGTVSLGNGTPTVRSSRNSISLLGQGYGRGSDMAFPVTSATILKWAGPVGGTVVKVLGPIGNMRLEDFGIDGNGTASIGLDIVHSYFSCYRRLNIRNWTLIGIQALAIDFAFAAMVNGCNENIFEQVISSNQSGTNPSAIGAKFGNTTPLVNSVFNYASNLISLCYFRSDSGIGLQLGNADHNTFIMTSSVSTNVALKFLAVGNFPNSNYFFNSPIIGSTQSSPTNFNPTVKNYFLPLSTSESAQNIFELQNHSFGVDDNTTRVFGFQKLCPLYHAVITSVTDIVNTTVETAFGRTYTIPAGVLGILGATVRIRIAGIYSTVATPTLTFKIKIGSVTIAQFTGTCANNAANFAFGMETNFAVGVLGAAGSAYRGYTICVIGGAPPSGNNTAGGFALDTTVANILSVTAQWSAASLSNSTSLHAFDTEISFPGTYQ